MGEQFYQASAYWFGPHMLRHWLWTHRSLLLDDTLAALQEVLQAQDINDIVQSAIISMHYTDIIDCLDKEDFRKFIVFAKEYWTDPTRIEGFGIGTIFDFLDKDLSIKQKLKRYFSKEGIRPRTSMAHVKQRLSSAASLVRSGLYILGPARSEEASMKIREGFNDTLEVVEYLLKIFTDFSAKLIEYYSLMPERPKDNTWFQKELSLYKNSEILFGLLDNESSDKDLSYVKSYIEDFARNCWDIDFAKRNELKLIKDAIRKEDQRHMEVIDLLNQQKDAVLRNYESEDERLDKLTKINMELSDETNRNDRTISELIQRQESIYTRQIGEIAKMFSHFRIAYRNPNAHPTDVLSFESSLPKTLLSAAKTIYVDAEKLLQLVNQTFCFPEIVRITAIEKGLNGYEIKVTTTLGENDYSLVYTDEYISRMVASGIEESLIYEPRDQDFWLFPALNRRHLVNPLLIPYGNNNEYELRIPLIAHVPPEEPPMIPEMDSEPEEPAP